MARKRQARTGRNPLSYRERSYRSRTAAAGLTISRVRLRETDLQILATTDVHRLAGELVARCRLQIETYIGHHRDFARSLAPLPDDELAPPIIRQMLAAGALAGVGPMAAVAGAIAEFVGRGLLEAGQKEVIVENGGDVFLLRTRPCTIGVFAGRSSLSNRVGVHLPAEAMPLGICTSSGTVGHSLSLGQADSVTVIAATAAVADAFATRLGNEAGRGEKAEAAIGRVLAVAKTMPAIRGVLAIHGETMGAYGDIELYPLS
ncbi:UPF0280 family protein [Desulfofustis limnaeus]|jgi:ApbE superfamily uncharacterized protein (UPF0280 family)|uniref:Thiamine biosynthesis protein ApbE n=1 Tax=Desulfofustis limnaeus TaxID=2740163 RepID=A0ABM7WC17_9BACT|nr:UPF0280 family protein [Desulfofustis limnaeus]MDX9897129.1 UPF0280 family protein [Desulfofustis sp.]BDD88478.1 thiamine biosynthesis protein ApbE [Desulfofustis limnaeus]